MTYSYNLGGALTSQIYPSGRVVSYGFDDAARLAQVAVVVQSMQTSLTTAPRRDC
jgi:hypothetical protein